MRRSLAVVALLVVGLALMANPAYLPVQIGESTTAYAHAVQPTAEATPAYDADDVVAAADLPPDARAAFERALAAEGNGFLVEDPDARATSLLYPSAPELGGGLTIVAYEGTDYEFRTYAVERESTPVVAQRVVVQPVAFLVGFFAVFAALAVAFRDRLGDSTDER